MHASTRTVAFRGIETAPVEVQVHVANGLSSMAIVGLADKAVGESRERVRAVLASIGLALQPKRIAINLEPADLVKEGAYFDLPIALGLLAAIGSIPHDSVAGHLVLGELSLHGAIEPVSGVLPAVMAAVAGDLTDLPAALRGRSRLGQRPVDRRGRGAQSADGRAARRGEIDAGGKASWNAAGACRRRCAGAPRRDFAGVWRCSVS